MRGGATASSLGWPFSASGILETSTMTALSRYLVMLGRAIEYKKAAFVKEKTASLEVRDQVGDPLNNTMMDVHGKDLCLYGIREPASSTPWPILTISRSLTIV